LYYDTLHFAYLYRDKVQSDRVTRWNNFSTMGHPSNGSFWSDILRTLFLIGTGGFIGSILRYLVSGYAQALSKSIQFPFGTLVVNLVGCALVGFLAELADQRGVITGETRAFLIVGILGGFTTFSAFGIETMNLLRDGELWLACGNIVGHTVLGLIAVWLGYSTAYLVWK
jgi:CrcB protein